MTDTPAKPRRRWLTFRLRTLFVVVTVAAILAAGIRLVLPIIHADPWLQGRLSQITGLLPMDIGFVSASFVLRMVGGRMKALEDGRVQYAGGVLIALATMLLWYAFVVTGVAMFELLLD